MSISSHKIVVLDCETTGVHNSDRIIEIAAMKIVDGELIEPRSMLIDPRMPIPEGATKVNNITNEMVAGKPLFKDVAAKLETYCEGFTLCAYNAPFDKRMMCLEHERAGLNSDWLDGMWLDPFVWVKKLQKFQKGKKLTDVCDRMDITMDNAHRALADVEATAKVLMALAPKINMDRDMKVILAQQAAFTVIQDKERKEWMNKKKTKSEPGSQMTTTPPWSVSKSTSSQ